MMQRVLKQLFVAAAVVCCGVQSTFAFSLGGPDEDWQTPRLGYRDDVVWPGPMNIGEEYRWNVPVVTYGFSPAFVEYFGERGILEIEKAIKILNDLPDFEEINADDYPLTSARKNWRAEQFFIIDLKSITLTTMLEQYGLWDPTWFVNTLRKRWTTSDPDTTNYLVIQRNFDPISHLATPYINGDLYTYSTIVETVDDESYPINAKVDPLALGQPATMFPDPGIYYTGLTRDDVGGLKYIYNPTNWNVETLQPNSALPNAFFVQDGVSQGSNTALEGAWWPVGFLPIGGGTNTNANTNLLLGPTNVVDLALRPGVGKLQFERVYFESTLGGFIPATHVYSDSYIQNFQKLNQSVERTLLTPDLVFDAGDTMGDDGSDIYNYMFVTEYDSYTNSGGTNVQGAVHLGPGIITGPRFIVFNTAGRLRWNTFPGPTGESSAADYDILWGSFDGTTNSPVVYPWGVSVDEVEYLFDFGFNTFGQIFR